MGKRLYLDFNIKDEVYVILNNSDQQVYRGVITDLNSLADDSYELTLEVKSLEFEHQYERIPFIAKFYEDKILDIVVIDKQKQHP